MNTVIIIGNLTKDPELRYSTGANQTAVCTFNVALNRGKDRNGNDMGADFPRVTVFGRQAENCNKYLAKGRKVAIQGHIHTDSYTDRNGNKVYTTGVIADRVEFLGGGQQQTQTYTNPDARNNPGATRSYAPQQAPAHEAYEQEQMYMPGGFAPTPEDEDIPF